MSDGSKDRQRGAASANAAGALAIPLRILCTTDLHAHVFDWDYAAGRSRPGTGLLALAKVIAQARDEVQNALLLDNGDVLQGSALGDFAALGVGQPDHPGNPVIQCMNALRYDAGNLGNHDFSLGLAHLRHCLRGTTFPIVSANVRTVPTAPVPADAATSPLVPDGVLLDRIVTDQTGTPHRLRIGVTGVLPPQTAIWERDRLEGQIEVEDMVPAAMRVVDRLKAESADLIILLAHSGPGPSDAAPGSENAALHLAGLPGVDVVVMGHTHQRFPSDDFTPSPRMNPVLGTLAGKPAVMPPPFGGGLGVIDLMLVKSAPDQRWPVRSHRVEIREGGPGMAATAPEIETSHRKTLDWVRTRIGRADAAMTTHFALVAPNDAMRLVALAMSRHVAGALGDGPLGHLPVLAAVAPAKAGGRGGPAHFVDIPAGDLLLRHVHDLCPHPDTVTALCLTGQQIADWLERAVSLYHRITVGLPDQALVDPAFPAFNFDLIDGLDYRIDLSQPARFDLRGAVVVPEAQRIADLTWRGLPVDPKARFILATTSHRSNGGQGFAGTEDANLVLRNGLPLREVLCRHIQSRGTRLPPSVAAWSFVPMPDTCVTFLSAPDAVPHDLNPQPEPLDLTPDGFRRFRLRL